MCASELNDFQFVYGDPRPTLAKYICDHYKDVSYYHAFGDGSLQTAFDELCRIHDDVSFIFAPIIIKKSDHGKGRHIMYLVRNLYTNELERIDIRKYHIDGFKLSDIGDTIYDFAEEKGFNLVPDLDAPNAFAMKLGVVSQREAYPLYVITYLHNRLKDPYATSKELCDYIMSLPQSTIRSYWKDYVSFVSSLQGEAGYPLPIKSWIYNPETQKHFKVNGPSYLRLLINNEPSAQCVELMIDEAMSSDFCDDLILDHVAPCSKPTKSIAFVESIIQKHPTTKAVFVTGVRSNTCRMNDIRVVWDANTKQVLFPKHFWQSWQTAMKQGARFLFVFVSVMNDKYDTHANLLVYDIMENELERFDSLGADIHPRYDIGGFDACIEKEFSQRCPESLGYFTPVQYFPKGKRVFQSKEIDTCIVDPEESGNCAVWRLWYIDVRLANPTISRQDLVMIACEQIDQRVGNMRKFIKSYQTILYS